MTLEELLKEEENAIFEASIHGRNRKAKKRHNKKENFKNETSKDPEEKPISRARKHKFPEWQDDGRNKFKEGRERTVSAVMNLCKKKGVSITSVQARDYIYEKFKQWDSHSKEADWIIKLEKTAKKKFGYDARKYAHINLGDTVGLGAKGDPEYEGRAYFFTGLINGFAHHFLEDK